MTASKEKKGNIDTNLRVRVKWGTTCIGAQNGKANSKARIEIRGRN
jgi:hypothetical protein